MFEQLKSKWEILEPSTKRWIGFGALGAAFLAAITLFAEDKEPRVREVIGETDKTVLQIGNGDAADVADLNAKMEALSRVVRDLETRNGELAQEVTAANMRILDIGNIKGNPEEITRLLDRIDEFESRLNSGASGVTGTDSSGGGSGTKGGEIDFSELDLSIPDTTQREIDEFDPLKTIGSSLGNPGPNTGRTRIEGAVGDGQIRKVKKIKIFGDDNKDVDEEDEGASVRLGANSTSRDIAGSKRKRRAGKITLATGSQLQGVTLTGLVLPAENGSASDPYPVIIKVNSAAFLPNGYQTEAQDCRILGAAEPDLSAERVLVRTERFSCNLADGGVIDTELKGFITGEDSMVGMRAKLVERTAALLSRAALAGFAGAGSEVATPVRRGSVQTGANAGGVEYVSPSLSDVGTVAAFGGVTGGMSALSEYYLERAEEIVPVLEVHAMRVVTIHLNSPTEITVKEGATWEDSILSLNAR